MSWTATANHAPQKINQGVYLRAAKAVKLEIGASQLESLGVKANTGGVGSKGGAGRRLPTMNLKKLNQGVYPRAARAVKIETGVSQLERLGVKANTGGVGSKRGAGRRLPTMRLKKLNQEVYPSAARAVKIEIGASQLERLGVKASTGGVGSKGGAGRRWTTKHLKN